jgi:hypothetical protein
MVDWMPAAPAPAVPSEKDVAAFEQLHDDIEENLKVVRERAAQWVALIQALTALIGAVAVFGTPENLYDYSKTAKNRIMFLLSTSLLALFIGIYSTWHTKVRTASPRLLTQEESQDSRLVEPKTALAQLVVLADTQDLQSFLLLRGLP